MLLVSTQSWHYGYYNWLRSLYGYHKPPDRTSLCPYFQTILWGSIFCILLSPFLVLGWLAMRYGRWVLKLESPFDPFLAWLDRNTRIIKWFNDAPNNFEDAPLVTGLFYTFVGVGCVSAVIVALLSLACFIWLLGYGAWHIPDIFAGLGWAFLHVGWAIFWIFASIGNVLDLSGQGAHWLFTNGALWINIGKWTLLVIGSLLSAGIVAVIVGYGLMLIARSKLAQGAWKSIVTKINGFSVARKKRNERVQTERKERLNKLPLWKCYYCEYKNKTTNDFCSYCGRTRKGPSSAWIIWMVKCLDSCFGRVQRIGKQKIHVLGWLSILIEFIKAMKKGVCPMVEFTSPEQLQDRTKKQRSEDEEKKSGS